VSFPQEKFKAKIFFCLFFSLLFVHLSGPISLAQTAKPSTRYALTPARQYELFQKILAFDRSWKKRNPAELNLAILYEKNYELSCLIKDEFVAAVQDKTEIEGLPVRLTEMAVEEVNLFAELFSQEKIFFLYVAPLSPSAQKNQLKKILALCNEFKIGTFTGETQYVDLGVAIGLGVADEKAQVIINLQAARKQGLELSSQLLRMSSIK